MNRYIENVNLINVSDWNDEIGAWEISDADLNRLRKYAIKADPVVNAEWVKVDGLYHCSKCNTTCPYDASGDVIEYWDCPRCPKCGAYMR